MRSSRRLLANIMPCLIPKLIRRSGDFDTEVLVRVISVRELFKKWGLGEE